MLNAKTPNRCGNCAHYDASAVPLNKFGKDWRPCRGATPSIQVASEFGPFPRGVFPLMPADEWCGQFKQADKRAVAVRVGQPSVEG